MHALLKLPVQNDRRVKFQPLQSATRAYLRYSFSKVCGFIIDEISMVSQETLLYMHLRMQEIFEEGKIFGGIPLLAFGDFLQLEPVKALPCYVALKPERIAKITGGMPTSLDLWGEFSSWRLTNNHRSAGDGNRLWRDILSNVALGMLSKTDVQNLNGRLLDTKDCISLDQRLNKFVSQFVQFIDEDKQPLCLFPLRSMCKEFNEAVMVKRKEKPVVLTCTDAICAPNKDRRKRAREKLELMDKDDRDTAGNMEPTILILVTWVIFSGIRIGLHRVENFNQFTT